MEHVQQNSLTDIGEYQDRMRAICCELDVVARPGQAQVSGTAALHDLGRVEVAAFSDNIHAVSRSEAAAKRDGGQHFFLILQREGVALAYQAGKQAVLTPGKFFVVDDTMPFRLMFPGKRSSQYSVHIPRSDFMKKIGAKSIGGVTIASTDALSAPLSMTINNYIQSRDKPANLELVGEAFFELLQLQLRASLSDAYVNDLERHHQALYLRARKLIDENFHDPNFSAADLARLLNMSPRQLQRIFRSSDETPSRALINRRLSDAKSILDNLNGPAPRGLVSTIAYDSGFRDLSYFHRLFRSRYGRTPGSW